jgi:hypothetical protein
MGIVTDYIRNLIIKQVDEYGLVLWYDPERHYASVVDDLSLPGTSVARYTDSFFALRHEIEPLMRNGKPPRLVIYVPLEPEQTHHALIEAEIAGVVMKPGQQPPSRNTRLSIAARNALKPVFGEATAATIEKQVETGMLTLADLDGLGNKAEGISKGVVSVIFGTSNPQEIALAFLSSAARDPEIEKKNAAGELAVLLHGTFEIELPAGKSLDEWRAQLARHLLTTDLLASLAGELPPKLATAKVASKPAARDECAVLARKWRMMRDLSDSYIEQAARVEKEIGLATINLTREQIAEAETFLAIERKLQRSIEGELLNQASEPLVEMARSRQSSFWAEQMPEVQARWALMALAGQLLLEAARIEAEIKASAFNAQAILACYTDGERPWSSLDTHHRHMERRYHNFDFDLDERDEALERLITRARQRYMEVASLMAERFLRRYQEGKFQLGKALRQTQIFEKKVKPKLVEGKTAYVWVDALRHEMARELVESLTPEFEVEFQPAVASVPTITEIGMAALLPTDQQPVCLVSVGGGKLALDIGGSVIKDRKDRIKFLKDRAGVTVFDARLDELLPNPKKRVRDGIRAAHLILITSQEIDTLGEEDNALLARRLMDDVLHQLKRAFRALREMGVQAIVVAADHGYLYGDELDSGMKIDAPGGETADLHRRVWIGRGGTAGTAYLRAKTSDFGMGDEYEIAAPWNLACFKAKGGASAYFHGGLSPQELIIPVVTLTPKQKKAASAEGDIVWKLIAGSQKISTRFFSVQITGVAAGLYEPVPPKVRVEIVAKETPLSTPISASYGFEEGTGDVQLRLAENDPRAIEPNTVTLMITQETEQKSATLRLLDATSGAELFRLDKIEFAITI